MTTPAASAEAEPAYKPGFISWLTCSQPTGFGWGIDADGYGPLARLVNETQVPVFNALGMRPRVCCHNPGGIYAARMVFDQFARREATHPGAIADYVKCWQSYVEAGGELVDYVGFGDPQNQQTPGKYLESSGVLPLLDAGHSLAVDSGAVKLPEDYDTALIKLASIYLKPGAKLYVEGVPVTWGAKRLWEDTAVMLEEDNPDAGTFLMGEHHGEKVIILKGDGPNAAPDIKLVLAHALAGKSITPCVPLYHWISRGVDVVSRWKSIR